MKLIKRVCLKCNKKFKSFSCRLCRNCNENNLRFGSFLKFKKLGRRFDWIQVMKEKE